MSIVNELQRIQQAKTDLKTAIEAKGVTVADTETIDVYAPKVDDVYNKGYEAGKADGGGGDSWYDTFWDACQTATNAGGGTILRTDYRYAFCYSGWTIDNFKPKYDIKPKMAEYMFYNPSINGDLVQILEEQGVTLDFSECTMFAWAFYSGKFSRIGVVDMRKVSSATNANNVFRACPVTTIDKLIVSETYPIGTSSFIACAKLENITIEGLITGNFTISSSPLTVESMKNIIAHLKDYAGTDKEFTYSVKFSSDCWEALDAEGNTAPNGGTWKEYVTSLGWTY